MKSSTSPPSSCKYPHGLPWMLLASPSFSVREGIYINALVLPCWTPSPLLALNLISVLGSWWHLKTLKPGSGYWEGNLSITQYTSTCLHPSQL